MNYKVMQRPMFKLGGKAASQGTGITSGLDEKVNYSIGGGVIQGDNLGSREGFQDPSYKSFLKNALDKYNRRQESMSGMNDLINLQAAQAASNALSEEYSNNPLDIIVNLAKQGTSIALPALSARKKLELKMNDPATDLAFAKAFKPSGGFGEKVYQMKKRDLAAINQEIKNVRAKDENADISALEELKKLIFSGFDTEASIKASISDAYYKANEVYPSADYVEKQYQKRKAALGNAEGGLPNRVERQMGSPMMGEQPQQMAAQQDVAMETQQGGGQDSGNKVYAMLRSRLPQEVSDEVVQLISYNKEAFADFASIKNQEDVSSFNEKYGVQLVIDVATV